MVLVFYSIWLLKLWILMCETKTLLVQAHFPSLSHFFFWMHPTRFLGQKCIFFEKARNFSKKLIFFSKKLRVFSKKLRGFSKKITRFFEKVTSFFSKKIRVVSKKVQLFFEFVDEFVFFWS